MARVSPFPLSASQIFIFFFFLLSFFAATLSVSGESYGYARTLDRKLFSLKKEKLSHFRLFWYDIYSGSKPTVVAVVPPQKNSLTLFGSVSVMDDPLTEGPELSSKLVGKAQGFYASAGQEEVGLLMVMNFVFVEGKYNGSKVTILGEQGVFTGKGDACDRRKWAFPVCKRTR